MYWNELYTGILRKIVAKIVHITISKVIFSIPLAFANRKSVASCAILSNFFEEQWAQNHLLVVYNTFSDNLSWNSHIHIFIMML